MSAVLSRGDQETIRDTWALAIGRFMMRFAECEWFTYQIVRICGNAKQIAKLDSMETDERANAAKACAIRNLPVDRHEFVLRTFATFASLSGKRKLVAHNSPMAHVYVSERGEMKLKMELRSTRSLKKSITLTELATLTRKSTSNAQQLLDILQSIPET